jgi:hypothetical protein
LDLLFSAIAFDDKGRAVAEISRALTGKLEPESIARTAREGFRFEGAIDYSARTKEVRFAVRNNASGDIGSVIVSVKAP